MTIDLKSYVRDIPGYPKPGIVFKDLTPLWKDAEAFRWMSEQLADHFKASQAQEVAAVESRGFILGSEVAYLLKTGFVPIRKAGKLPWDTAKASYSLEYGEATSEIHMDAFLPGARVLIIDDLLATGGTAEAAITLVRKLKGQVVGLGFLAELSFLKGRQRLSQQVAEIFSLIQYDQP